MSHPARTTKQYSRARVLAITAGGSVLEYYDYALYGIAAALIFNAQFFPNLSSGVGTVVSLATFASGVLMKPLGALVFSHFGDRLGRARVLFVTMIMLGVSTMFIGALPNYDSIGVWAPIGLVTLRLVQGFAAGAEMPGSAIFGMEAAPGGKRGLYASFTSMGSGIGATLALAMFMLMTTLVGSDVLYTWAWRIPFFTAGAILIFVFFARRGIVETEKESYEERTDIVEVPIREVVAKFKGTFAGVTGVVVGYLACSGLAAVYALTYLKAAGYSDNQTFVAQLIFQIVIIPFVPVFGVLSDRTNRKAVLSAGAAATAACFMAFFTLAPGGSIVVIYVLNALLAISMAGMYGGLLAFAAEQFPARVRYSGMGVAFSLGDALGGGLSPVVAASIYELFPDGSVALATFSGLVCLLVVVSATRLKNHSKSTEDDLEDVDTGVPPGIPTDVEPSNETTVGADRAPVV